MQGQVAWVVGGVGTLGTGLARGLLKRGATVIVNSRHNNRLQSLSEKLGAPENLVAINSSMLPGEAEATVKKAMEMTSFRLDHVVAHSGVGWWSEQDETGTVMGAASLLHMSPDEYGAISSQLGSLHFAAAHHLTPLLSQSANGSYNFVTSGADAAWGPRSTAQQINSYGVMGLAAAMRSEAKQMQVRVNELRLGDGIRLNRAAAEREAEPRERPMSQDIGEVVAGLAASSEGGYVPAADLFELDLLKTKFA